MLCAICVIALSASMIGCGGSYGNIQRSREVGKLFENTEILPDHNYYYSGPDAIPYALIGIDKKYTLESRYWKRINLTEEQLRRWIVFGMQGSLGFPPNGSYIYGPGGEKIGVWYSIFDGTVVRMSADNHVKIYPPSYYPGKNARPAIERGSADSPEPLLKEKPGKEEKLMSLVIRKTSDAR